MSQWWQAVGNPLFELTSPTFEPHTSHSRGKRATSRPTGWSKIDNSSENTLRNEEKAETPGSSSNNGNPTQNAVHNVIVEHVLDLSKMWTNHNL